MMFPEYFVLRKLQHNFSSLCASLEEFYIISVQHLLESTGSMFEALIQMGINPKNIFLTGKIYSTHLLTKERLKLLGINIIESTIPSELGYYKESLEKDVILMWQLLLENLKPKSKIIILDDGGYTLKNVPKGILSKYAVFGIEQTTSGIRMQKLFSKFPIIHLAASAAKIIIEPPIVSEAVKIQISQEIQKLNPKNIGIIGFGNIGKAVVKDLHNTYQIGVCDINKELKGDVLQSITYYDTVNELYSNSEVIIGATGQDVSDLRWLNNSTGNKTLISISSGDIEFNRLLKHCKPLLQGDIKSPLQILNVRTTNGHNLKILRGGMVANFTGSPNSSPGKIIQITRGLLFAAVMQIIRDYDKLATKSEAIMLDPYLQSETVNLWFEDQPQRKMDYSEEIVNGFKNIDWIKAHSQGCFIN